MKGLLLVAGLLVGAAGPWAGVNLSGAEFGADKLPGRVGTDYVFPGVAQLDWAAGRGFRVVRLPVLWERLQPAPGGGLDEGEVGRVRAVVAAAAARGLRVILDVHSYGRFRGVAIGSARVPAVAFAGLWRELATAFRGDGSVVFGLMNEPQVADTLGWRDAVQKAVLAIRETGAGNLVLVPGAGWDGAHDFTVPRGDGVSNAAAMAGLVDPAGALAFEVHQYLDADHSGTHPDCPEGRRVEALLQPFTDWLRAGGRRGVLGEFAGSERAECLDGLRRVVRFLQANGDVWLGWAYWGAGAWWPPGYPFLLQGKDGGDRAQLRALGLGRP